jgi:hypothetical protein
VSHLEPYPHHRGPLNVVGLGEGRPPTAGTDVSDNGLDPAVTMVPVRGGRDAPPVKAAISVDPDVGRVNKFSGFYRNLMDSVPTEFQNR